MQCDGRPSPLAGSGGATPCSRPLGSLGNGGPSTPSASLGDDTHRQVEGGETFNVARTEATLLDTKPLCLLSVVPSTWEPPPRDPRPEMLDPGYGSG